MITIDQLAQSLGTTTEMGVEVPVIARHVFEFDQTLPQGQDGDYEISDEDAATIREAWGLGDTLGEERAAQALVDAQERVTALTSDLQRASTERDHLLAQARQAGTSAADLAALTGLNRSRVYQILERAGL